MVEIEVPTRVQPITYAGYAIRAPGFDEETFAAGITRALSDGLTISPGRAPRTWLVANPASRSEYVAHPRHGCSCASGHHRSLCKHRALVLLIEAVTTPADRPGGVAS